MDGVVEPSPAVSGTDRIDRANLTWPERVVIVVALFGAYAPFFFYFLVPSELLSFLLLAVGAVSAIPLAVFSLQALFRLRWKSIFIFALVWALLCLFFVKPVAPQERLRLLGFYVRTRLIGDYLSRCRLIEFTENGVRQAAGSCEGFDRGLFFEDIVYDTTGEFMRPVSQRTQNGSM